MVSSPVILRARSSNSQHRVVDLVEDPIRALQKSAADDGQIHLARGSLEKPDA